jgi:hypothetical protein
VAIELTSTPKPHWNYFIALERDLEVVSRYVEFTQENYETYSIELAHVLFAAASEVDVVAKRLCQRLNPEKRPTTITAYGPILVAGLPTIASDIVLVPRYGLTLTPWAQWAEVERQEPPLWWSDYNKVKHQRDEYFKRATLKNALNAMAGLMRLLVYFYRHALATTPGTELSLKDTTDELLPSSTLLRLPDDAYRQLLALE